MMKRKNSNVILFCLLTGIVLLLQYSGFLKGLEYQLQDSRYQKGGLVSPEIYVIGIDEETLMDYGPWQDWSREKTAELIAYLNEDPMTAPAVIGVDIGFFGESRNPEQDTKLAEASALLDNVVTTSYAAFGKQVEFLNDGNFQVSHTVQTYEIPYPDLREHVTWGFSNMPLDADGIVRHTLYQMPVGDELEYSFAVEVYRKYMGELPSCILQNQESGYISFSGFPYDYYGSETAGLSLTRVLDGTFPKELFAGCIVLVGPYSAGMMDSYYTAVSHNEPMYGVEVHANILQMMLDDVQIKESGNAAAFVLILLMGALTFAGWLSGNTLSAAAVAVLLLMSYWFLAGRMYVFGYVMPVLYPIFTVILNYIGQVGWRYVHERREKKHLQSIFGRYVSDSVVSGILKGGEDALKLGGQKKDIAVLFVDVRGFTPLSEGLEPEVVVEILNRYFEVTTSAIFEQGGTVDKFIGDAAMAIFNAPLDLDDYVYRAVICGLAMAKASRQMEEELERRTGRNVGLGIGINCGEAVIGNIGTARRMEYTAIGSIVNTASRLEGRAKAGEVVIGPAVYERLKGRIQVTCLGKCSLKGIQEPMELYRVEEAVSLKSE